MTQSIIDILAAVAADHEGKRLFREFKRVLEQCDQEYDSPHNFPIAPKDDLSPAEMATLIAARAATLHIENTGRILDPRITLAVESALKEMIEEGKLYRQAVMSQIDGAIPHHQSVLSGDAGPNSEILIPA